MTRVHRCRLCGEIVEEDKALAHIMVAHGPLLSAEDRRKRKRVKGLLPNIHRWLEEMGLSEPVAHLITRAVAEELRQAGMV